MEMAKKPLRLTKQARERAAKSQRTRSAYLVMCEHVAAGDSIPDACKKAGILWPQVNAMSLHHKDLQEKFHAATRARADMRREAAEARLHELATRGKSTIYKDADGNIRRSVVQDDVEAVRATLEALSPEHRKDRGPLIVHNTLQVNNLQRETLADILQTSTTRENLLPPKRTSQVIDIQPLAPPTSHNISYEQAETKKPEAEEAGGG
jgi:hypothetical protein